MTLEKSFAASLMIVPSTSTASESISHKDVIMVEGIPHIKWMEEEVETMNKMENLQYAVVGKFTYEWTDLEELRRIIPQQCAIKASIVGKPVQLGLATIKRIRPSCARVKVLVDLKGDFHKSVIMDIVNEATGKIRKEVVIIKYDYICKYFNECKMQVHNKDECKKTSSHGC
ncbi:hypothetical protein KY284_022343 [Solanum tuberosum]|nr:hypothetical protein KY284_022343 [Solanum tuberosum]